MAQFTVMSCRKMQDDIEGRKVAIHRHLHQLDEGGDDDDKDDVTEVLQSEGQQNLVVDEVVEDSGAGHDEDDGRSQSDGGAEAA